MCAITAFPQCFVYSLSCNFSLSAIYLSLTANFLIPYHIFMLINYENKSANPIQWDYVSTKEPVSSLYPDSCSAVSSVCV